jgi:hypothetical protein
MDKDETRIRKYESALNLLFYEGQIAWQLNIVFIALNVGLTTLIGNSVKPFKQFDLLLIIYGILGVIISIAWLGTFKRNNRYYNFRMAQAREAEPESWHLLSVRGYRFSKGKKIIIDSLKIDENDKTHQLTSFEQWVSNKKALNAVIILFFCAYVLLLALSLIPIKICG